MEFATALVDVCRELNLSFTLKNEQKDILKALCNKEHCFGVLPTGFGKSLTFILLPLIMDKLEISKTHLSVVIMPLKTLIKDQALHISNLGIKCGVIAKTDEMSPQDISDIHAGNVRIVLATPESILGPGWSKFLRKFRQQICCLALDEVHCMIEWGDTFRPIYKEVHLLRSILSSVPMLLLSATITSAMADQILAHLCLEDEHISHVAVVPNRQNIHLKIDSNCTASFEHIRWYWQQLLDKKEEAPRAVIFTRSIDHATELYGHFFEKMEHNMWKDGIQSEENRLIEIFHAHLDPEALEGVPKKLKDPDSSLRCVISTIALGMGIQIPNIDLVIHWGPPASLLDYWQEVGRCARDGRLGTAVLYCPPYTKNKLRVNPPMMDLIENRGTCIRKRVLLALKVLGMTEDAIHACCGGDRCCSYCDASKDNDEQ